MNKYCLCTLWLYAFLPLSQWQVGFNTHDLWPQWERGYSKHWMMIEWTVPPLSQPPVCHRCSSASHRFTCATSLDQAHLQLVCQSAPLFKLWTLTDSEPDRLLCDTRLLSVVLLPACSWSTQPVPDQPVLTCLLSVPNHKLLNLPTCEFIKGDFTQWLCHTWIISYAV